LPEIDLERVDIGNVGSACNAGRRDRKRDIGPVFPRVLRQIGAPRQRQALGPSRRIERGVVGGAPTVAADSIGQCESRLRLRIGRNGDHRASRCPLRQRGVLALRLQRFYLIVQLARLGERRAQVVAQLGKPDRDRVPGRAPLPNIKRLGLRGQFLRPRLRKAHDHRAFGVERIDRRLPSLPLGAQTLQSRVDGIVGSDDLGGRDLRVHSANRDFRRTLPLYAQRGRIQRKREILENQSALARRQIDLNDARNDRSVGVDRYGVDFRDGRDFCRPCGRRSQDREEGACGSGKEMAHNGVLWRKIDDGIKAVRCIPQRQSGKFAMQLRLGRGVAILRGAAPTV
jgi:hypothetical protein